MKYTLKKLSIILAVNCFLVGILFSQQSSTASSEEDDSLITLDPFILTEVESVGYATSSTAGGSRFNVPILDLSHSVVAVNRELMQDTGAIDSYKALQYVSGLGPASTVYISAMIIRGIDVRGGDSQMLDGLPASGIEQETEFIDRFEVVKGAAGTLYGQHSMGGVINRVYKNPLDEQHTSVGFTYSSLGDTFQFNVDNSGPIDKGGQLKYRVAAVFRDGETVSGGADEKEGFYGTFSYSPNEGRSRMWARGEFRHVKTGHETPTVFYDNAARPSLDVTGVGGIRTVPVPNNEQRDLTYIEFGASHAFGEGILGNWNMRLVTRYNRSDNNDTTPDIIPIGYAFVDSAGEIVGRIGTAPQPVDDPDTAFKENMKFSDTSLYSDIIMSNAVTRISGPSAAKNWGVFFDLTGEFKTGPIDHRLLIYSQFQGNRSRGQFTNVTIKEEFGGSDFTNNLVIANAFSVLRQNKLPESSDYYIFPDQVGSDNESTGSQFAVGIQDNLSLAKGRILLTGGARFDDVVNGGSDNLVTGVAGQSRTQNNWVYKFGAVGKPIADTGISLFYNFSQTFIAQFGEKITGSGILFDNLTGEANEIGVKMELFNSSLVMTASYFDNELESQPIRIFNEQTGLDEFLQGGTTTVKGWEMDMAWQVTEQIGIVFGMGELDSLSPARTFLRNVQNDFNYKFLGRYRFTEGGLKGLTTGVSVVKISDRIGNNNQSFTTDGYTTIDAFVYYDWQNWRFQINAYNLADKEEVISSIFGALALAENERNVRFSVSYSF